MEEIICPHCGVSQKINPSEKVAFCSFCGSSLTEILVDIQKDQKKVISEELYQMKSSSQDPRSKTSSSLPFSKDQQIPSLPRVLEQNQGETIISSNIDNLPFQSKPPEGTIVNRQLLMHLEFPQLKKNIAIPSNLSIYHFGRNIIIPLVNSQRFDVDWLNSISRVQKLSNGTIRQHFKLFLSKDGKCFIEDNVSRWGTWVNRQQIKGRGKIPLNNGDRIELMLSKPNIKQVFPFVIIFKMA